MRENFNRHNSETDFRTPLSLFLSLENEFGPFDLDAAASFENALCEKYFTKEDNGLIQRWEGAVWCNPPYDDIGPWVGKASRAITNPEVEVIVLLLPARATCTRWFRHAWETATEIRFIHGRLDFTGPHSAEKTTAPFGSMLLIYDDMLSIAPKVSLCDKLGKVLTGKQALLSDF